MSTGDGTWGNDVNFGGNQSFCCKTGCSNKAVKVGIWSPAIRVTTCEAHEDELKKIREMMRENPYPRDPPTETATWRKETRPEVVKEYLAKPPPGLIVPPSSN